jgi:hypothetical protein
MMDSQDWKPRNKNIAEVKFQNLGESWDEVKEARSPSQASKQVDLL